MQLFLYDLRSSLIGEPNEHYKACTCSIGSCICSQRLKAEMSVACRLDQISRRDVGWEVLEEEETAEDHQVGREKGALEIAFV